ncbi:hypothetical protein EMIT0P43_280002 [Pseudomonas jessenii]
MTPRRERRNSSTLRNSSRLAICRQIAPWVSESSWAALVKLSWRAAASKLIRAVVLGIFLRMYVNLTNTSHKSSFATFRSEKLAQQYAKSSFAVAPIRA